MAVPFRGRGPPGSPSGPGDCPGCRSLVRIRNDLSLPVDQGHAGPGDAGDLLDAGLDFLHGVQIDEPRLGHQFVFDPRLQLGPDLASRQKPDDPDGKHGDAR